VREGKGDRGDGEVVVEGPTQIYKDGRLAKGSPTLSAKPAERMGHPEEF